MKILFLLSTLIFFALTVQAQQSNKHFWYTQETAASSEDIWKIWIDVDHWHLWDSGLKKATLSSTKFDLGAKGIITSLENRKSKFKVVDFKEGEFYTFKTKLPLSSLYVKRYLEQKNGKTYFTHEVWFKGLTSGIFAKNFGPEFRKMLPGVLESIKELAEKE